MALRNTTDLEFISTPSAWPWKDRLPMVKRYTKEVGIMTQRDGVVEPTVILTNLFGDITPRTIILQYKSFSALLRDGWRID